MKNAMQLKSAISKIAKEKHIPGQLVMQNYMLERLLERISRSKYQGNFILKGHEIDRDILRKALSETAKKRHSDDLIPQYRSIVEQVVKSTAMLQHWKTYQRDYEYARGVEFSSACETIINIMDSIR